MCPRNRRARTRECTYFALLLSSAASDLDTLADSRAPSLVNRSQTERRRSPVSVGVAAPLPPPWYGTGVSCRLMGVLEASLSSPPRHRSVVFSLRQRPLSQLTTANSTFFKDCSVAAQKRGEGAQQRREKREREGENRREEETTRGEKACCYYRINQSEKNAQIIEPSPHQGLISTKSRVPHP